MFKIDAPPSGRLATLEESLVLAAAAAPSLATSNGSGAWVVPVTGVGNTTAGMGPETVEAVVSPVSTSS